MALVDLARQALAAAARVRQQAGLDAYRSICVYDLAEKLEIDLRFQAVPSLEGMYSPGKPPIIVVSALRPSGRQRLTCAHEIGHHSFGHRTRIDQLVGESDGGFGFDPDEFLVNCFAEYLLMPKLAVLSAFAARGVEIELATPLDIYRIASYFGAGYSTLVHHLGRNLRELPGARAAALRKTTPKSIRTSLVGDDIAGELLIADRHWNGRPIDLHVGDALLVPHWTTSEGRCLRACWTCGDGDLFTAVSPGLGRVVQNKLGWACFVRVAKRVEGGGFVGRGIYRHEEDDDD